MTKAALLGMVRRGFEELTPDAQDRAARSALGVSVFFWDYLTVRQLVRVYGAVRAVALLDQAWPLMQGRAS